MRMHNVYVPVTTDRSRPSAVQSRVLAEMRDGATLVGRFDVWGGYDWIITRPNGMVSNVPRVTVQGLLNRGAITMGATVRVESGRHDIPFSLPAQSRGQIL